jgi:hypothetical protein
MFSTSTDTSIFKSLKKFLAGRNQYPFSWKRRLLNIIVSFYSYLHFKPSQEPYDVLFILSSPDLEFRYLHIVEVLKDMNLKCKTVFFSDRDIVKLSLWGVVYSNEKISTDFAIEKGFASYLKEKYTPKIIFQANDSNYISTFLKRFSGAKLINIAHCVSCTSANFDVFDYHYYFIFGNSSICNLKKNNHAYGSSQLVRIGSLFLKKTAKINPKSQLINDGFEKHIVFSSQWSSQGITEYIQWSRGVINSLAERNPNWKITIKCHPLETDKSWVKTLPNLFIEIGDTDFRELLREVAFHVTHHSAFALESSVCNVPTICVQKDNFNEDCLKLRDYFPIINNVTNLEQVINEGNNTLFNTVGFAKSHLDNIGSEIEVFRETVIKILSGDSLCKLHYLAGTHIEE